MKVSIVTGYYSPDAAALAELTLPTKRDYCVRWGYDLVEANGPEAWDALLRDESGEKRWNHLGFSRTRAVQLEINRHLGLPAGHPERCEFVLWMDADSAVTNPDIQVGLALHHLAPNADAFVAYDGNGLQSGIFAFRVSAFSAGILEAVWTADKRHDLGSWWEQGAMHDALVRTGAYQRGDCLVVPPRFFNAYWEGAYSAHVPEWLLPLCFWQPWSFALHTPGIDYPDRIRVTQTCLDLARQWRETR